MLVLGNITIQDMAFAKHSVCTGRFVKISKSLDCISVTGDLKHRENNKLLQQLKKWENRSTFGELRRMGVIKDFSRKLRRV